MAKSLDFEKRRISNYEMFDRFMEMADHCPDDIKLEDWCGSEPQYYSCKIKHSEKSDSLTLTFNCRYGNIQLFGKRELDDNHGPEFVANYFSFQNRQLGKTYQVTDPHYQLIYSETLHGTEDDNTRNVSAEGDDFSCVITISQRLLTILKIVTSYNCTKYSEQPLTPEIKSYDGVLEARERINSIFNDENTLRRRTNPRRLFGNTRCSFDYSLFEAKVGPSTAEITTRTAHEASVVLDLAPTIDGSTYRVENIRTWSVTYNMFPCPDSWDGRIVEGVQFGYERNYLPENTACIHMEHFNLLEGRRKKVRISREQAEDIAALLEIIHIKDGLGN